VTPAAGAPGTWWVGATGFDALGGERTLLGALRCIARRWHPEARAAVADSCVAAHVATWDERQRSGVIVPPGRDAAYLAPAPLGLIPMDAEMREALLSLGVRTAGALAALEPGDVERRWGDGGLLAWRLARGEDRRRPVLARAEGERRVEAELAAPVETTAPALFFVQAAVDRLVREHVDVRATATTVEVFHRGRRVTSHAREYGRRRFLTKPEHMPAAHRANLEWTPSKLIAWGRSVGPPVGELVEKILNTRPHPEHGYRACMGLKRLFKRYGPERLTAACQRALATGGVSYSSVDAILKHDLDRAPLLVEPVAKVVPIHHANLRGAAYYQQLLLEA
jgi:transposase